jgi:hypothetical protein
MYDLVAVFTDEAPAEDPLSGRVAGEYRNSAIHAIQTSLRYQF